METLMLHALLFFTGKNGPIFYQSVYLFMQILRKRYIANKNYGSYKRLTIPPNCYWFCRFKHQTNFSLFQRVCKHVYCTAARTQERMRHGELDSTFINPSCGVPSPVQATSPPFGQVILFLRTHESPGPLHARISGSSSISQTSLNPTVSKQDLPRSASTLALTVPLSPLSTCAAPATVTPHLIQAGLKSRHATLCQCVTNYAFNEI